MKSPRTSSPVSRASFTPSLNQRLGRDSSRNTKNAPKVLGQACPVAVSIGLLAFGAGITSADIFILDQDGFQDAAAGITLHVEDFESHEIGPAPAPFALSNGLMFSGDEPFVTTGNNGTQALINNSVPLTAPRIFSAFAPGTRYFSTELSLDPTDEFDVIVECASGDTLTMLEERGGNFDGFLGVFVTNDSIVRVTVRNTGEGSSGPGGSGGGVSNYGFDRVSTDQIGLGPCPADLAAPYTELNFFDTAAFLEYFAAGESRADLAAPLGTFNFFDVSAFLGAYNAGCP